MASLPQTTQLAWKVGEVTAVPVQVAPAVIEMMVNGTIDNAAHAAPSIARRAGGFLLRTNVPRLFPLSLLLRRGSAKRRRFAQVRHRSPTTMISTTAYTV